jgi:recombination protein RecA
MARTGLIKPRQAPAQQDGGGLYFSTPKANVEFIRTGATVLDCVLGGGWALGRIANIVGDKSTGKTLLAMEAIANFLLHYGGGKARYNEAEAAFDPEYADALGIPIDRVNMIDNCKTVEAFYNDVDAFAKGLKKGQPGLYILDSLDGLSDAAEMERDIGEGSFGAAKAKKLSEFFRRKTQELKETRIALIIISQVRDAIGVTFGGKDTRSGGRALDFYCSQTLWLAHTGRLERTVSKIKRVTGVKIRAKNSKNKVGLPFRDCNFEITFGFGIEDEKAARDWLVEAGDLSGKGLEGEALRNRVITRWYEIEKTFLPTRRKYGGA